MNPQTLIEQNLRLAASLAEQGLKRWNGAAAMSWPSQLPLPTAMWPWKLDWREASFKYPQPSLAFDEVGLTRQMFEVMSEAHRRSWEMAATVLGAPTAVPGYSVGALTRNYSEVLAFWMRSADEVRAAFADTDAKTFTTTAFETMPAPQTEPKKADVRPMQADLIEPSRKGPEFLDAPRGQPDDLTLIKGIGEKLNGVLHSLGIYHYWQIAAWTPEDAEWVSEHLQFRGRIQRERWIEQCRDLVKSKAA